MGHIVRRLYLHALVLCPGCASMHCHAPPVPQHQRATARSGVQRLTDAPLLHWVTISEPISTRDHCPPPLTSSLNTPAHIHGRHHGPPRPRSGQDPPPQPQNPTEPAVPTPGPDRTRHLNRDTTLNLRQVARTPGCPGAGAVSLLRPTLQLLSGGSRRTRPESSGRWTMRKERRVLLITIARRPPLAPVRSDRSTVEEVDPPSEKAGPGPPFPGPCTHQYRVVPGTSWAAPGRGGVRETSKTHPLAVANPDTSSTRANPASSPALAPWLCGPGGDRTRASR